MVTALPYQEGGGGVRPSSWAPAGACESGATAGHGIPAHLAPLRLRGTLSDAAPRGVQVGMPSMEEVISAGLDHKMAMAGYNVRKFLSLAQDGVDLGSYKGVVDQVSQVSVGV